MEKNKLAEILREKEITIKNLNKSIVGLQISKNKFFDIQKTIQEMNASNDLKMICDVSLDFIINIITYFYVDLKLFKDNLGFERGDIAAIETESPIVLDKKILDWILETNRPFFSSILEDPEDPNRDCRGRLFIIVPIKTNKESYGYIKIHPTKKEDNITQDELAFLSVLSNNLANALENAYLNLNNIYMKNYYNWVINSMSFGILTMDNHKCITYVNKNAEFLLNLTSSVTESPSPYKDLVSSPIRKLFDELLIQTKEEGPVTDHEYEHVMGDGVTIPLGFSTSVMRSSEGKTEGIIFVIRDLTLTREIIKLRELDRLKSDFINAATHEFRNPLTSIMVISEYLENLLDAKKMAKRKLKEYVKMVRDQSQSLSELVEDLLDIARMEAQGIALFPEYVSVAFITKNAIQSLVAYAKSHQIAFNVSIPRGLKLFVDRKHFKRVLMNLISNAIKYTPQQATVSIKAYKDERFVYWQIQDQGIGLRKEDQMKVFEKFYRVKGADTAPIKGHGLGLSIVKRIINAHKGDITVESEIGKGTIFTIKIPKIEISPP